MKRLRNLWPQVTAFDNLWRAWRRARRGKSRSSGAVHFEMNLEGELPALQRELQRGLISRAPIAVYAPRAQATG
ncbi:MAG: hypothetical protein IPK63_23480 [Candidatus Competibacteraceae bacterium]|nr:hypothetical protein [Candidatus Competibacteraceae bacterium]